MKIAIIGLGLMGGSLALSLKKQDYIKSIVGYDHNQDHTVQALKLGLVDEIVSFSQLKKCDVIFLAIPVDGLIATLATLTDVSKETTIIDLGSTKAKIVTSIPPVIRKNFVAAHPMTGTENFGPSAAVEGLYDDKVVVLCDLEDSGKLQSDTAKKIFTSINMRLTFMRANEHDRHAAFISHMPHAISYSIANAVMKQENKHNILALAAGGYRSMSRLAKSSPNMWEDIFRQNKDNILEAITHFEEELTQLKNAIATDDWEKVHQEMSDGNKLHDILD
ncbi:prephenate dehydrogenase [Sulfurimonas sp.]|jgi:prephenate dehydrogenase|uniref:prephenate dehydrogenase n=1 Tax=Sulfurimonas sp. TaxID=2022749 RepID=UPI0025FC06AC|nr:prephenate dehydrogenase [Sulfurimonas sp.]MBT5934361.1 prephenate dehydrogenase [Sulfurimonas sp.]